MDVEVALALLGLSHEGLSEASVKEAYRRACLLNHPDRAGDNTRLREHAKKQMRLVNEAHSLLGRIVKSKQGKYGNPLATSNMAKATDEAVDGPEGKCEKSGSETYAQSLDSEQRSVFSEILESGKNFLVTGKAGTGKSYLLQILKSCKAKTTICLAPTGRAALNIEGLTLHSFFGYKNLVNWGLKDPVEEICQKRETSYLLRAADLIVIDEVSMVRADIFSKIDAIMRTILHVDKPFGGKQVVLFGDIFQLPPVVASDDERRYLEDSFGGPYFFEAPCYEAACFEFVELTVNHRQKDDRPFFAALNALREGSDDGLAIALLNTRCVQSPASLEGVMRLFPSKLQADLANEAELERLKGDSRTYVAASRSENTDLSKVFKEGGFPVPQQLTLKVGAQVMFVQNDSDGRWVNGTLGTVASLKDSSVDVTVGERTFEVPSIGFEENRAIYGDGRIRYEKAIVFYQLPLVLAYAITIHKAQGLTCERIACDVSGCFSFGQAYVAISRCKTLEGLHLLRPVTPEDFTVDPEILKFYFAQLFKKGERKYASFRLAELLANENIELSAKLLDVSAREGNPDALCVLGEAVRKTDSTKAAHYFEEALQKRVLSE